LEKRNLLDPRIALEGIEIMEERRGPVSRIELCNGPAKLCQAFGVTREQNGVDLEGSEMWLEADGYVPDGVAVSTRVGLTKGKELPLRFYLPDNHYVSRGKPSAPLPER